MVLVNASANDLISASDKTKLNGIANNGKASNAVATQSSNSLLSATDKKRLDKLSSKNMNMNLTNLYSTQLKGGTCQVTLSKNIPNFIGLIFESVDNGTKMRLMRYNYIAKANYRNIWF